MIFSTCPHNLLISSYGTTFTPFIFNSGPICGCIGGPCSGSGCIYGCANVGAGNKICGIVCVVPWTDPWGDVVADVVALVTTDPMGDTWADRTVGITGGVVVPMSTDIIVPTAGIALNVLTTCAVGDDGADNIMGGVSIAAGITGGVPINAGIAADGCFSISYFVPISGKIK
jgi:hypothetical protein